MKRLSFLALGIISLILSAIGAGGVIFVSGGYAAREISLTAGNSTEEGRRCDWPDGLLQSLQASL